ncbi:hypothetical protein R6Q59_000014 [Mikania micrantha]
MYGTVRKSAVDANFKKLGVEILSIGDIESLEWEALAAKIGKWIRSVKLCVSVLFASEKTLCQLIFQDLGTDADEVCFMETVKAPAIQLFSFAEAEKLTRKFTKAAIRYQRATWTGVLYCLRDVGLYMGGSFLAGVSKSALRERFKSFNAMFIEAHKMQALWLIPDLQLREELRTSISEKLILAYRSFLGRLRTHIEQFRHPENYIKCSVEDLELQFWISLRERQ